MSLWTPNNLPTLVHFLDTYDFSSEERDQMRQVFPHLVFDFENATIQGEPAWWEVEQLQWLIARFEKQNPIDFLRRSVMKILALELNGWEPLGISVTWPEEAFLERVITVLTEKRE